MKLISSALLLGLAPLANADCVSDHATVINTPGPTDATDPADYSDAYCAAVTAAYNSCNGGSTSEQGLADAYGNYKLMCDSTTCDYMYYDTFNCLTGMGSSYTQADVDACCGTGSSTVTAINTACSGQTTLLGVEMGANFYLNVQTICNNYQGVLDVSACSSAHTSAQAKTPPGDGMTDPAAWNATTCAAVTAATTACSSLTDPGDGSIDSLKAQLAAFGSMCDPSSCDYKYSAGIVCLQALDHTATQSQLDGCCAQADLTAIDTACDGQTKLYGQDPLAGQGASGLTTANWYTYVGVKCSEFQTNLDGGAGSTALAAMAVAAAAAAAAINII